MVVGRIDGGQYNDGSLWYEVFGDSGVGDGEVGDGEVI